MSEIKLEVGQGWEGAENRKWTILGFSKEGNNIMVLHRLSDGRENKNTRFDCGYCREEIFRDGLSLITNADGTPYVKPNDYRDGDVWQNKSMSGLYSFNNGLYRNVFDVNDEYSIVHDSSLFNEQPQDFKLIYRKG